MIFTPCRGHASVSPLVEFSITKFGTFELKKISNSQDQYYEKNQTFKRLSYLNFLLLLLNLFLKRNLGPLELSKLNIHVSYLYRVAVPCFHHQAPPGKFSEIFPRKAPHYKLLLFMSYLNFFCPSLPRFTNSDALNPLPGD